MQWKVKFFQTARGDYPVKEFIEEQDIATQTKIANLIRLLIDYGPFLKPPYAKKMQNKLYELRVSGQVAVRVFYTIYSDCYYLLHAFKKKSKKTPMKELKIAIDRAKDII